MHPDPTDRPLAVTGASSGIGLNLARIRAEEGHDMGIAADAPMIRQVGKTPAGMLAKPGSSDED